MTRRMHRSHIEPRIELAPLLDVIFLLLTFFIYSQVLMIRAHVLPVKLPSLSTGEEARPQSILGITLDAAGGLYLNQDPIEWGELEATLREAAGAADQPAVFVAVADEAGETDRGPMVIRLMELVRSAGVSEFSIVGRATTRGNTSTALESTDESTEPVGSGTR